VAFNRPPPFDAQKAVMRRGTRQNDERPAWASRCSAVTHRSPSKRWFVTPLRGFPSGPCFGPRSRPVPASFRACSGRAGHRDGTRASGSATQFPKRRFHAEQQRMRERYARFPGPSDPSVPPHRSRHGSVSRAGEKLRKQLSATCLICGLVSVPEKTRFGSKPTSDDFVRAGQVNQSRSDSVLQVRCACSYGRMNSGKAVGLSLSQQAFFRRPSRSLGIGRCPASGAEAVARGYAWRSRRAARRRPRRPWIRSGPRCSERRHGYDRWSD
jgi:hypothetical protein